MSEKKHDNEQLETERPPEIDTLTLTFSGDLMAHDVNFNMADYSKIYDDIRKILQNDDLSFTNIEMPVCDTMPMSNYPRFNVHSQYIQAAIDGGFDVFSLANNHSNDKGIPGIDGTLQSMKNLQTDYLTSKNKKIYFSGLKTSVSDKIQPILIEYKNWRILYLSITELLNSHDKSKGRVYYVSPKEKDRNELCRLITEARKSTPCDICILSLHVNEAEYGFKVNSSKKKWFQKLADSGVDIICGSHPHVMQEWEIFVKENEGETQSADYPTPKNRNIDSAFFMYSMGNFISGQRMSLNYNNPNHYREYTGDAVLLQVKLTKIDKKIQDSIDVKYYPITVYRNKYGFILKQLTHEWIESLTDRQKQYYSKRLDLMKEYLPF